MNANEFADTPHSQAWDGVRPGLHSDLTHQMLRGEMQGGEAALRDIVVHETVRQIGVPALSTLGQRDLAEVDRLTSGFSASGALTAGHGKT